MNLYSISISPPRNEDKSSVTNIHELFRDCNEIINSFSNKFISSLEHGSENNNLNHVQICAWSDNDAKVIKQKFTRKFDKCSWWNGWGKPKSGKCAVLKNRTTEPHITVYPLKEHPEFKLIVGISDGEISGWAAEDAAAPDLKKNKRPVKNFLNYDRAIFRCAEYVEPYLYRIKPEKKIQYVSKVVTDVTYDEDDLPVKKRKVVRTPIECSGCECGEEYIEENYHYCGKWSVCEEDFLRMCMEKGMDIYRMYTSNKKAVMYVAIEMRYGKVYGSSSILNLMFSRIENDQLRLQDQQPFYNLVDKMVDTNPSEGSISVDSENRGDAVEAKFDFID